MEEKNLLIKEMKTARREHPDLPVLSRREVEEIVSKNKKIQAYVTTMAEEAHKSKPGLFPVEVLRECLREAIIETFLRAQAEFV